MFLFSILPKDWTVQQFTLIIRSVTLTTTQFIVKSENIFTLRTHVGAG